MGNGSKMCPFCQTAIQPGQPSRQCDLCMMPHHSDCWQENGGCTTFGCPNSPIGSAAGRNIAATQPVFSQSGHIEITLEDLGLRCAGCGADLRNQDTHCPRCGTVANNPSASYGRVSRTGSGKKDPVAACLLNILLPGAGYFYLGQTEKGFIVLILSVVGACATYGIGYLVGMIYSMIDCYMTTKRMAEGMPY